VAFTWNISCLLRNSQTKENHGDNLWQVDGGFSLEYFLSAQELERL